MTRLMTLFFARRLLVALLGLLIGAGLLVGAPDVRAQAAEASTDALGALVKDLARSQSSTVASPVPGQKPWRVEVVLGQLDPRLKLAPCEKVQPYMPAGVQMWGKTRVGLRCERGPVRWNVFWPVTVKVWGEALVAAVPLRAGTEVQAGELQVGEVDLAAETSPAVTRLADAVGRTVLRAVEPGQSVRQSDFRTRRWFMAGDPVRLNVRGAGFLVTSEGVALTHGDEGRCARVKMDNGRVVCAQPVAERLAELTM